MYSEIQSGADQNRALSLPRQFELPSWYAAQIGVNQERQVDARLRDKGIDVFVPFYEELRRRSDRKVKLQVPLFPGYVFVRIALRNRRSVLETPRVVRLVSFGPQPVAIPEQQIECLRAGMNHRQALPHPYLQVGRHVRVITGPFSGTEGILLRRKSGLKLVISISAIVRSFTVEVDESEVEPIRTRAFAS